MKLKHIVFLWVMMPMLCVFAANADDKTQIITSQAYVDTRLDTKADVNLSNLSSTGSGVILDAVLDNAASGTYDGTENYDNNTIGKEIKTLKGTVSTAGSILHSINANAADASYDSSETYDPDTIGGAIQAVANTIPDSDNFVQNGTNALELTNSTTKSPSVTAVKGISDSTASITRNAQTGALTVATSGTAGNETTKVPTTSAVASGFTAIKDTIEGLDYTIAAGSHTAGRPVTAVTQTDGKIAVTEGQVSSAGIADGAITNTHVATNAAITYSKMNSSLPDINTPAGNAATCTAASPCVLSFYMDNSQPVYTWTAMQLD